MKYFSGLKVTKKKPALRPAFFILETIDASERLPKQLNNYFLNSNIVSAIALPISENVKVLPR